MLNVEQHALTPPMIYIEDITYVSSGEGIANMGGREVTLAYWLTDHAVTILEDDGTLMDAVVVY